MSEHKKPTLKTNYELEGNSLPRQGWHWVRMKTSVMGNYHTGPGLKNLIILWVMHKIGKPLFKARVWFSNQHALKQKLKRIIGK